jgi:eukaryotic-like serine/threonine-protein kinase
MAEVLLARSSGIEGFTRHVVIKRIRPGQAKDQAFVQMFLNEARLAAQLHHANIVQVHDIGQEGNEYFFAMEYVHGEDLRRLLTQLARHKQKLPLEHVITIISAAAVALHHAHEQRGADRKPLGIVHRDVTPANILVGYDGNVKVVDFGIAKAAAKTEETQAGTLKGKASYMSPEQCTGSKVDRRSDVFALGIVLYELVTTRRLFKCENDFLTMSAIVGGKVPRPKDHRPDLPDALQAIIMKTLALKAEERYQSADAVREALEQFAETAGLRLSTSALAAYLKQQFGERPEPWLVDDEEPEMELVVDFDGSASALVSPPEESIHQLAIPQSVDAMNSSPIVKARTKAITNQPSTVQQAKKLTEPPPTSPSANAANSSGAVANAPATRSKRPSQAARSKTPSQGAASGRSRTPSQGAATKSASSSQGISAAATSTISSQGASATTTSAQSVAKATSTPAQGNAQAAAKATLTSMPAQGAATTTAAQAAATKTATQAATPTSTSTPAQGNATTAAKPTSTATPAQGNAMTAAQAAAKPTSTAAQGNATTTAKPTSTATPAQGNAMTAAQAAAKPTSTAAPGNATTPAQAAARPTSTATPAQGNAMTAAQAAAKPTSTATPAQGAATTTQAAATAPAVKGTTPSQGVARPGIKSTTPSQGISKAAAGKPTTPSQGVANATSSQPVAKIPQPLSSGGKANRPLTAQIPAITPVLPSSEKSRPFRIDTGPVPAAPAARRKPITVQIPTAQQTAGAKRADGSGGLSNRADGNGGLPGMPATRPSELSAVPQHVADPNDSAASTFVADAPQEVDDAWDVSRRIEVLAAGAALAVTSSPAAHTPPIVEAKSTARADQTPKPAPAGQAAGSSTLAAKSTAGSPALDSKRTAAAARDAKTTAGSPTHDAKSTAGSKTLDATHAADDRLNGTPTAAAAAITSSPETLPAALPALHVATTKSGDTADNATPTRLKTEDGGTGVGVKSDDEITGVDDNKLPQPPVLPPKPAEAPKTWSLAELATIDKQGVDKNDVSTTAKFDVASLSSSRTDVSGMPRAPASSAPVSSAASSADVLAAADAAADAESKRAGTDGRERDSAPSLPPPPVARKSVKLPGVAQVPDANAEPGSVAAKFAATNVFNTRAKTPSNMPESWPGGTASIRTPWSFARLVRSPKYIAMAAGALVLLVVVIVFATGGSKQPTAAPALEKPKQVAPTPMEPANVTQPVPPEEPTETTAGSATTKPAKPTRPVQKPPAKVPPKRVATQPAPAKPAVKPATKPAVKPATKPATKPAKPPAKKWDPNTLFPTRK